MIVLSDSSRERADVTVVAAAGKMAENHGILRRAARDLGAPVILITDRLSPDDMLTVVRYQVMAVLPRRAMTAELLIRGVTAVAAGDGLMPPQLAGGLLEHLHRLQRTSREPTFTWVSGLTEREIEILQLVAEGLDTTEIAEQLRCSTRTVKSIMYNITHRLNLRNRTHAVAHAMRTGLIE
ncbi:regulatory protein, luxR family [Sinosporangium album]|uniref:Regulatory protein, luxR family n=1 Tax=Sinosporangium album TaxID=504805 RepID=A0A1G8B4D4_9ACTN|nr:regulatory protein, luxR family [Sinosporangium album]